MPSCDLQHIVLHELVIGRKRFRLCR